MNQNLLLREALILFKVGNLAEALISGAGPRRMCIKLRYQVQLVVKGKVTITTALRKKR